MFNFLKQDTQLKFGKNLSKDITAILNQANTFCVTDETVANLYPALFSKDKTFIMPSGEDTKSIDTITKIADFLLKHGADRHSHLVGVGGGVVGDITGFAASCYMRGINFSLVPTTLLAQVDSSIGGKTGVNFGGLKNIIGAFYMPKAVYLSAHFIKTLPDREFLCGIGEVIKTAALSKSIFDLIFALEADIYKKSEAALEQIVKACAKFKASVVKKDPKETLGVRKMLNYGHTIGHAFESADEYRLSHGEYILHGMRIENRIFKESLDPQFFRLMDSLIDTALQNKKTDFCLIESIAAAASLDKKNKGGKISFIAITKPGTHKECFFTKDEFAILLKKVME